MSKYEHFLGLFSLEMEYTQQVIDTIQEQNLDELACEGAFSIRQHIAHLCMVLESIPIAIHREEERYADLKDRCADIHGLDGLVKEGVLVAVQQSVERALEDLKRVNVDQLDERFRTIIGNYSSPRNYLFLLIQEIIHHRAQIMLIGRTLGDIPPTFPGREIAEWGVPQD